MKNNATPKKHGIPTYFKKIGLTIMVLALLPGLVVKIWDIELAQHSKELIRVLTKNAFILGVLLIALAKDKIEDEMIGALKLRTMAFAFVFGVLIVIITPLVDLISNDSISEMSGHRVVLSMLVVYLITYYLGKRKL